MTVLWIVLGVVLMLVGLAGVILPILPGVPLAWLGLFIYALGTGFERISVTTTVIFLLVVLVTLLLDFLAPMLGARKYRASWFGVLGATIGLLVGIVLLGFWGIILGPFVGALLAELLAGRQPAGAVRSAFGTFVGFLAGTVLRLAVVLSMIGFFIVSLF